MQHDTADELDIEVPHLQHAPAGLAHYREGLRQHFVQRCCQLAVFFVGIFHRVHALMDALPKLFCLGPELLVGELLHLGLERTNMLHQRHDPLDLALIGGAKNLGDSLINQFCFPCGAPLESWDYASESPLSNDTPTPFRRLTHWMLRGCQGRRSTRHLALST